MARSMALVKSRTAEPMPCHLLRRDSVPEFLRRQLQIQQELMIVLLVQRRRHRVLVPSAGLESDGVLEVDAGVIAGVIGKEEGGAKIRCADEAFLFPSPFLGLFPSPGLSPDAANAYYLLETAVRRALRTLSPFPSPDPFPDVRQPQLLQPYVLSRGHDHVVPSPMAFLLLNESARMQVVVLRPRIAD